MPYETSYDAPLKTFGHDRQRGKWATPMDFIYACLGHAFQLDAILIMPSLVFRDLGIYVMIPYLIVLAVCVVPLVFLQTYLGQFSSTGFISAFRIAPLYKGVGYVSLAINLIALTYTSIFGAIPLFHFFSSFQSTLPWSCDGVQDVKEKNPNWTMPCGGEAPKGSIHLEIPTFTFFWDHLNPMDLHRRTRPSETFSLALVMCSFLIWVIIGLILIQRFEVVARMIRYSCMVVVGLMVLCVMRLAFLSGALNGFKELVSTEKLRLWDIWSAVPLLALSALGPGWGSIISMASYNNFKTDIHKFSWMLCLAQYGVIIGLVLMSVFTAGVIDGLADNDADYKFVHAQWMENLLTPFALTHAGLPHFWSFMYFGMMVLASINILTVHFLSVLTSIFDEFAILRPFKREVILAGATTFALTSIYFCSNHGLMFAELLAKFSMISELFLNILLVVVVLHVYGRERFQRDVKFIINRVYSTFMVNVVRFVVPFLLLFSTIVVYGLAVLLDFNPWSSVIWAIVISFLPWCFAPGYSIYTVMQTRGMLRMRFKRCSKPNDWYPADPDDRQSYEEVLNGSINAEQLADIDLT